MQYSKEFIKELEQLSFHVNNHSDTPRPLNWQWLRTYENFKTGFYAESFVNKKGIRVLVFAGTNPLSIKDDWNDWKMLIKKIPMQADDAFKTYKNFQNRYEKPIIVLGYSLGGSLAQIVCNETGANGITFAAYGVGDIVEPKNTNQIINYGNENDPIFKKNIQYQLGENYIIPDSKTSLDSGMSISKHLPNKMGDVTKAKKQSDISLNALQNKYILDRYKKRKFDESILMPSNRIFLGNEKMKDMDEETLKQFVNQYYNDDYKFPSKEELERRVRFGELIYVESYTRADGTKVSGYYRRYPD